MLLAWNASKSVNFACCEIKPYFQLCYIKKTNQKQQQRKTRPKTCAVDPYYPVFNSKWNMHRFLVTDQYLRAIYVPRSDSSVGDIKWKLSIAVTKFSTNFQRMESPF